MSTPEEGLEPDSYYARLGVARDASEEAIRRAYRGLASSLHPDKARDERARESSARLFSQIQEAYEVLSDPARRDVYDVYGREGLAAGLTVSADVAGRARQRADWEAFQARRGGPGPNSSGSLQSEMDHRGAYVFKVDATALASPYAPSSLASRAPELSSMSMSSVVDVAVDSRDWGWFSSAADVAHLGGLVSVQRSSGGGSFIAGYRRVMEDGAAYECQAMAGLQTLLSASSSIQFSELAGASLTANWQAGLGPGLVCETHRVLSRNWRGELAWVVGPAPAAGASLGLHRRGERGSLLARVEVGASTALALRLVRRLGADLTARLGGRLSLAGPELEVGLTRKLRFSAAPEEEEKAGLDGSPSSAPAALGSRMIVGPQGVTMRVALARAGHAFEFPILLSPRPDLALALAAAVLPPLLAAALGGGIIAPLARRVAARRMRSRRQARARALGEAAAEAADARTLLAPVAARRAAKEARQNGLVVALALYGEVAAVEQLLDARVQEWRGRAGSAEAATGSAIVGDSSAQTSASTSASASVPPERIMPELSTGESSENLENFSLTAVDVTIAVQYLVDAGQAIFFRGYSRSGLMGFCDPAPDCPKILRVLYTYRGQPCVAQIADMAAATLPAYGNRLTHPEQFDYVKDVVRRCGDAAAAADA